MEERKISLRRGCYHGNVLDNTYSLCHIGMKESDELIPPSFDSLHKTHTLAMSKPHWPSPLLLFPVGALSLCLKERRNSQSDQMETR